MSITDSKLRGLSAKKKKYLVSAGNKNLSVLVQPSGKKSFVFRYFLNGKTARQITLGEYPSITLAQANTRAETLYDELKKGEDPQEYFKKKKQKEDEKLTFQQAWDLYDQKKLTLLRSRKNQLLMIKKDVAPEIGNKRIDQVSRGDILRIFDRLAIRNSLGQANRLYARLSHFFQWAETREMVNNNPMAGLSKTAPETKRTRRLSKKEIHSFWNWLQEQDFDESFKIALKILLMSAQRISTLCLAKWKEVDFNEGTWYIPPQNQKKGGPQTVFLSPLAKDLFKQLKLRSLGSQYVLPSPKNLGKPVTKDSIEQALKRSLDKELLKDDAVFRERFTPHDFRRTFSSHMNEKVASGAFAIEKILSHKLTGILAVYNLAEYTEQKKKIWFAWSRMVESLFNKEPKKIIELRKA